MYWYDLLLEIKIKNDKALSKYLHHEIQNEIIGSPWKLLLNTLLLMKICSTPFLSIIVDSTQDISIKDQMSVVIRSGSIKGKCHRENEFQIN